MTFQRINARRPSPIMHNRPNVIAYDGKNLLSGAGMGPGCEKFYQDLAKERGFFDKR
jgi:hypothetical protein